MFTDEQLNKIITLHTCRDHGFCLEGIKTYVESLGFNFRQTIRSGIPVRDAIKLDDALLNRLVKQLIKEG